MRRGMVIPGLLLAAFLVIWFGVIPYPWTLDDRNPERTALMEQRIEEAREAGVPYEIRQEWVSLDQISPELVQAVIVAEDHRFRQHEGVDWRALAEEVRWTGDEDFQWWSPSDLRALGRAGAYVWGNRAELRGRSTITIQLAKNLYFGTERSLLRKAMELVVARRLEGRLEKDRILELYLNVAELGPGIFGVQAAAESYFGRSAAALDAGSAVELAATLPHPLTSNPARSPRRMLWRKELILRRVAAPPGDPPAPLPVPDFDVEPGDPFQMEDSLDPDVAPVGGGVGVPPGDSTPAGFPDTAAPSVAEPLPSDSLARRPDPARGVAEVAERIDACRAGCAGVVYLWSDRMPLSVAGMDLVARAAKEVDVAHAFLESEALASWVRGGPDSAPAPQSGPGSGSRPDGSEGRIAEAVLASGALGHAPALVVYADGQVLGPAIYGFKTAPAYTSAIRRRLERRWTETAAAAEGAAMGGADRAVGDDGGATPDVPGAVHRATRSAGRFQIVDELEAVGRPGAYFRWVPGREAIAYESGGRIYLLDLGDGRSREAPGYVDFVPTPDGRFFVTPAPRRSGMAFYDADEVFRGAEAGNPDRVEPFFTDRAMRDQYPSVGILREEGDPRRPENGTEFRVLTSWFEGISYRDYRVTGGSADRRADVRPVAEPVEPCPERRLSIPIMSQSGREVAARDESTGTTKIFRIREDGRCDEVLHLGVQTGKVAWHWSGRLLAFARSSDGIHLYDREEERLWRVPDSEDASSLAFPEFIGGDRLVYLVPGGSGEPSVFRVVEGSW